MKQKKRIIKQVITAAIFLFSFIAQSQESPIFRYFDESTINNVKIDYDMDGDLDYVYVGVIPEKHQGRVYLVENKEKTLGKPEYIYSFPTIPVKQHIDIQQKKNVTTIRITGTSPKGIQTKYVVTLFNGKFEGLLTQPVTSDSQ